MKQAIIELNDLGFEIDGQKILQNINLSVNEGDIITIIGPSGSGKSTLLKLIGLQMNFTSGSIQFKGKDISDYNPIEYRKDVSYFFQNAVLFGKTVRDNLSFPAQIRNDVFNEKRAIEGLEQVQLSASDLDKDIHDLSGGERQRIALIRNLMYPPKVLLMDEVTSSLDKENRENILSYIKDLNKKHSITVLWVTHNQDEINAATRTIEIIDGKLEEIE